MTEHLPLPTAEMLYEWEAEVAHTTADELHHVASRAAQWGYQQGADAELEACCEQLRSLGPGPQTIDRLRAARRPKSTFKQQALEALQRAEEGWRPIPDDCDIIRRALEQLDD